MILSDPNPYPCERHRPVHQPRCITVSVTRRDGELERWSAAAWFAAALAPSEKLGEAGRYGQQETSWIEVKLNESLIPVQAVFYANLPTPKHWLSRHDIQRGPQQVWRHSLHDAILPWAQATIHAIRTDLAWQMGKAHLPRLQRLRGELERGQPLAAGTVATWKPGLINRHSEHHATILILERLDPPLVDWDNAAASALGEKMDVRAAILEQGCGLEFRYLDSRRLRPTRGGEEIKALVEAYNKKPNLAPGDRVYWRPGLRNWPRPGPDENIIVTAVLPEPIIHPEADPSRSTFREPLDVRAVYSGQVDPVYEVYLDSHRLEKVEEP